MAKFTNHTTGPRGISLKDGTTKWLEPGQSVDLKKEDVVEPLPDLGRPRDAAPADSGDLEALQEQVAALTKQVEDLTKERDDANTKLGEAEKANTALTKQVEDLTKERDDANTKLGEAEKANTALTKQVEDLTKPAPQKT